MTRLEANINDFHVKENAEGKIETYRFRFGKCDDFHETMQEFKKRIPFDERRPNPDSAWLWDIKATPLNRRILGEIFDNFEMSLQAYESQMKMFGL